MLAVVYDDVCGKQAIECWDAGERAETGSEERNNATNQAGRQAGREKVCGVR